MRAPGDITREPGTRQPSRSEAIHVQLIEYAYTRLCRAACMHLDRSIAHYSYPPPTNTSVSLDSMHRLTACRSCKLARLGIQKYVGLYHSHPCTARLPSSCCSIRAVTDRTASAAPNRSSIMHWSRRSDPLAAEAHLDPATVFGRTSAQERNSCRVGPWAEGARPTGSGRRPQRRLT